jgi:hypothetical protein
VLPWIGTSLPACGSRTAKDEGYDRKERLREFVLSLLDRDPGAAMRYLTKDDGLSWPVLERATDPGEGGASRVAAPGEPTGQRPPLRPESLAPLNVALPSLFDSFAVVCELCVEVGFLRSAVHIHVIVDENGIVAIVRKG